MFKKLKSRRRKGQFFIIGAVLVVMALFTLSSILNQTWEIDMTNVQFDSSVWIFNSFFRDIENVVETSSVMDLQGNLDEFVSLNANLLRFQGYSLEVRSSVDYATLDVLVNATLMKKGVIFHKASYLNLYCAQADPDYASCNTLTLPTDKAYCCRNFRMCC